MKKPIIAITMGDPGGIGPEVIAKTFRGFEWSDSCYYLLIGISEAFEYLSDSFNLKLPLNPIPTLERAFLRDDSINFLDVSEEASWLLRNLKKENTKDSDPNGIEASEEKDDSVFDVGRISKVNASMAYASLKVAAYQASSGLVDAVVTAPVNKTAMRLVDAKFKGHTEYLAKVSRTKEFAMMFVSDRLKVTLVTIHVPLKQVSRLINKNS